MNRFVIVGCGVLLFVAGWLLAKIPLQPVGLEIDRVLHEAGLPNSQPVYMHKQDIGDCMVHEFSPAVVSADVPAGKFAWGEW